MMHRNSTGEIGLTNVSFTIRPQIRRRIVAAGVVCLLTGLVSSIPAFAVDIVDDPTQIDERATQLIQTTNTLCWEMHRFHRQQPDYRESYDAVKGIWSQAGHLQEALRVGPVETEVLIQQVTEMNAVFIQVEQSLSKWETGDRSSVVSNGVPTQQTVVRPGAEIDIPFVGIRVGAPPVVVTEDGPPQIMRKRLHPNSAGSKRSLERDLAAVKVALNYLMEDSGIAPEPNSQTAGDSQDLRPVPQRPTPDSRLKDPKKAVAPTAKKSIPK